MSRDNVGSPPRLVERLVQLVAARDRWGDTLVGDLREEFVAVQAARGRAAAAAWYCLQAAGLGAGWAWRGTRRIASALGSFVRPQGDHVIRTLLQETRYAVRTLFREPLVTIVVVVTLAVGLGANAATFGMIESLLLRPFTFQNVDRLVMLSENSAADPYPRESVAPATFLDFKRQSTTLDGVAAFHWRDVNLAGSDRPHRVEGHAVSADFFRLLGATPAHGRLFGDADMIYGRHHQVVLSHSFWKSRFGADPAAVGRSVTLDGQPYTIVGVVAAGFDFPMGSELWLPMALSADHATNRTSTMLTVIGQRPEGVTLERVSAELEGIYARIRSDHPEPTRGRRVVVRSFTEGMVDVGMPQVLLLWQAAAVLVLLIGCTNVANLLLARGAARQRELAVRLAIGAGRWRVVRQLLIESMVLSLAAMPAALGVAALTFTLCRAAMPAELVRFIPGWTAMGVNTTLLLFTIGAALVSAILFGLLPAVRTSRPALTATLREGGRSVTGTASRSRLRRGLVVAEIALALPLLIASGLAAVGAQRVVNGPQGYDPDGAFRLRTMLPEATYQHGEARRIFAERLIAEALRQPGVEAAGTTTILPAAGSNQTRTIAIDGRPAGAEGLPTIDYRAVSSGYLSVMRIPIVQGRGFTDADREGADRTAIISQSAARRFWPNESPLGKRIQLGGAAGPWITVVGVCGDTMHDWFVGRWAPTVYVPVAQSPSVLVSLVLRTSGDPAALAAAGHAAVAAVDPRQPVFEAMTLREALRVRTTGLRFVGGLMAAFGGVALLLAAIGIYSVMAFFVTQRRHEMGIRVALGATSADVVRLTIGHGTRMAGLGIAIGLAAGIGLARVLESALFGVISLEPWLAASVTATLGAVALLASFVPARQAAAMDPVRALRQD